MGKLRDAVYFVIEVVCWTGLMILLMYTSYLVGVKVGETDNPYLTPGRNWIMSGE